MSSGISQALVTTVLGLTVAIPLIFLHSLVMSKFKACIIILEEQSAGLAAQHAEEKLTS
jgi:biopolymer transport protein ExbB